MKVPEYAGLLVRMSRGAGPALAAAGQQKLGIDFEPLFPNAAPARRELGLAETGEEWFVARAEISDGSPWERAHAAIEGLGFADGAISYAEPDLLQQFPTGARQEEEAFGVARGKGVHDPQDPDFPVGPGFAWFLGERFSELGAARSEASARPRILHIDTGYDPSHATLPARLQASFARDFESSPERKGAADPGAEGLLRNPGHGTATLAILACSGPERS